MYSERGTKGGVEKREPVGMAKQFNFKMPVNYAMFKLTIQIASTRTTNFVKITQLPSWANTIFNKIRKSVNSSNI